MSNDRQAPPHIDDLNRRSSDAPPSSDGIPSLIGKPSSSTTSSTNSEVLQAIGTLSNTVQQLAADMSRIKLNSNLSQEMRPPSHFVTYCPLPISNPHSFYPTHTNLYVPPNRRSFQPPPNQPSLNATPTPNRPPQQTQSAPVQNVTPLQEPTPIPNLIFIGKTTKLERLLLLIRQYYRSYSSDFADDKASINWTALHFIAPNGRSMQTYTWFTGLL
ncbi:hypothetical protein CROQUDRAFT_652524 [Cronartium quercuum f. sp. fusiforme G11]|uniref:Uncharacterized protein n=1 Tax=Cronartium quercuum f. sp. fusiforme G11 TaxID=708437 RepID=A0A9P6NU99_9BASI|nr:hypothetical protein CROQUDRAFT_652524 [Cronartium quercuum f. sp. fusiforme G11]